jgi:hypothetical protein
MTAKVAAMLTSEGVHLDTSQHPIEGLLLEVARSAAAVSFYGQLVADLKVPDAEAGVFADLVGIGEDGEPIMQQHVGNIIGPDHNRDLAPHVLIHLWNQERDRHAKFCKMALDAGVAERAVSMNENTGRRIAEVIQAVLSDPVLGLTEDQRMTARRNAARQLALMTPDGPVG